MNPTTAPTTAPTTTPTTPEERMIERMKEITELINRLYGERADLGRKLPPVRYKDLVRDGNFIDRTFERGVDKFMREHMTALDTTLLDREDPDKWELLLPRYETREVEGGYAVWDHDEGAFVSGESADGDAVGVLTFEEAQDADERMCDLQSEDEQNRHGFPFAWNWGWVLGNDYWLDELRGAGFLVYRYDGDAIIAGIDGGGYSFKGAHFAPLYAALAAKNGWMIETNAGPRYLTLE